MYRRILVTLENSPADATIIEHVRHLARHTGASVVLVHVADGWVARNIQQLKLRESEEMRADIAYLEGVCAQLRNDGLVAEALLAAGAPGKEIAEAAQREGCDLIAMATHGHRLVGDLVRGSVANEVRHRSLIPVLLVRHHKPGDGAAEKPDG